jgi:hypothetical protein
MGFLASQTGAQTTASSADRSKPPRAGVAAGGTPGAKNPRTIAPFPVPADTSAQSVLKWRTLNLPRTGLTTIAPLPPPGGQSSPNAPMSAEDFLRLRIKVHETDCPHGVFEPAELLSGAELVVPPSFAPKGASGIIRVYAIVDEAGDVAVAETRGTPSPMDSAAVAMVRRTRFKPARHCDHALPVLVMLPVRYIGR